MDQEVMIRRAEEKDIPAIIDFIRQNWKEDHIFVRDIDFFRYMCTDETGVNFIIGVGNETQSIYGMEGYIRYNEEEHPDISGMMWRTIKSPNLFLGYDIDNAMGVLNKSRFSFGSGINVKKTRRLVQFDGAVIKKMNHYYRLNDEMEYRIAVIKNKKTEPVSIDDTQLVFTGSFEELSHIVTEEMLRKVKPFKSRQYLKHRYFEHPIYKYDCYAVSAKGQKPESVIIGREVEVNGSRIFRIMDFLGDETSLQYIGYSIDNLIKEKGYEYIDFYNYGIDDKLLKKGGFSCRMEEDENIIPNYFEPFERKNVEIYTSFYETKGVRICKGDADQDRPN